MGARSKAVGRSSLVPAKILGPAAAKHRVPVRITIGRVSMLAGHEGEVGQHHVFHRCSVLVGRTCEHQHVAHSIRMLDIPFESGCFDRVRLFLEQYCLDHGRAQCVESVNDLLPYIFKFFLVDDAIRIAASQIDVHER